MFSIEKEGEEIVFYTVLDWTELDPTEFTVDVVLNFPYPVTSEIEDAPIDGNKITLSSEWISSNPEFKFTSSPKNEESSTKGGTDDEGPVLKGKFSTEYPSTATGYPLVGVPH